MLILGIETSCDETAAAIVKNGSNVLSNVISSQVAFHKKYGGVVPEIASRKHQEKIIPVITEALVHAKTTLDDIEALAVTQGPGLVGSLLVGINVAKAIAYARKLPLVGINHLEGHLLTPLLEHRVLFPNITLIVSGGHTNLYLVRNIGAYELLGKTRDDAAGEAFDKVAKLLNLGYPGGVIIDSLAKDGDPTAIDFPRPMIHDTSFDFSFSGLKTAVRYHVKRIAPEGLTDETIRNIVASFQSAAVDILVAKTLQAAMKFRVEVISIAGGVACNSQLRRQMKEQASAKNIEVLIPSPVLCTDNAAMIALAGEHKIRAKAEFPFKMNAVSRWQL